MDKRGQDGPTPPHDGLEGEDHPHEMHARRVPHLRSAALTVAYAVDLLRTHCEVRKACCTWNARRATDNASKHT
jgi:hypothetical protein